MSGAAAPKRFHAFRLFQDFVVLASGTVGGKLIGFVAFAYLGRALDPESYGGLEYVVSLVMFFGLVVDGGLGAIGVRRTAQNPELLPTLAFQVPAARLLIAAIAIPVMAAIATNAMASSVPPLLIWLYALSLLFAPWRQEWLLQASERMTENAIAQVIRAGVYLAFILVLVKSAKDLPSAGWAELVSVGAMTLFCLAIQHFKVTPVRVKGSFKGFFSLMKEGAAISSTNLVWATNQSLPLILIGSLVGGAEVGLFAVGARIVGSLLTFSNLYHFNLFPTVTRARAKDPEAMALLLSRSFRVISWGGVLAALTLTLFAQPIVDLTFGNQLSGAALPMAIMVWALPIALWSGHARWGLTAAGEQGRVLISQIAGLMVIAAGCPLLGHLFGLTGYAIGATAGPVATWVAAHVFAARKGNQPPSFLLTVAPLVLAIAAIWVCEAIEAPWWARAAAVVAYCALTPLLDRKFIPDLLVLGRAKSGPATA